MRIFVLVIAFVAACVAGGTAHAAQCPAAPLRADDQAWNGWADPGNTRMQRQTGGINRDTTPRLKLKWAFGFPDVTTAQGQPTVYGGRLLVGDANGVVYELDARTGCTYWTYRASGGVRAAPALDNRGQKVFIGDLKGNVYALDAASGKEIWKARADDHPKAVITGSPRFDNGRLFVPVSGRDDSMAATNPAYECCTFRGNVAALDANTGKRLWQAYTIAEEPGVTGTNAKGTKTWGPSGAVPWSSPTLDPLNGAFYIGTGVNYSKPTTNSSDAVMAFRMDSGKLLWSRQLTREDSWNFACGAQDKTNCPRDPIIDVDFGNSGMLSKLTGGGRVLVISDKGGTVYGIDPDHEGRLLWKTKVAKGGVNGGTMWGGATDGRAAYIGISDFTAGNPETGGGLTALRIDTGEKIWFTPAPKPACGATKGCSAAQPAPVTLVPGAAFLGSWDGYLRAYETGTGKIIWDFDTLRDFASVNGVKAHGGSINSMGAVVVGGMVYITSGYSGNAMPGNVLLALSIDGK
jgi:polyvinyl alcohol dehydrogenase (cytochrome)